MADGGWQKLEVVPICHLPSAIGRSRHLPSAQPQTGEAKKGGFIMRRTLALTFILLLTAFTAQARTETVRRGFNVPDSGTLHLDAAVGSITIVAGGTGVAFEIVQKSLFGDDDDFKDHKITFDQRGNDVYVESDYDRGVSNWFHNFNVEWNIRVPAHYNIDVKTSGGSIDLADLGGTVDARTSGGSIKTGHLASTANLKTSGGSITVEGARGNVLAHTSGGSITVGDTEGYVDAKTSGGSITIAHANGEVAAHTSGDSIRIQDAAGAVNATTSGGSIHASLSQQPKADSRLSTSGGGVTVTLARNIGVELDAHASGGGVNSDVPITVMGRQDDDTLRGSINGGGPKLVVRSSGGGIHVRRL